MREKFRVVSLFSGCGGMDYGLEGGFEIFGQKYPKNPFTTVFSNDINAFACETLAYNLPHISPVVGSIADVPDSALPSKVDVVTGGFPCQTFSHSGKREGLESERGQLYRQMKRVVEVTRPKMFIAENVDGLRTSTRGADTTALDHIVAEFEQSGYDVAYQVLKAVDYGVPQTRVRVIIIGVDKKYGVDKVEYPAPTHGTAAPLLPYRTAHDSIGDLWSHLGDGTVANHAVQDYSKGKFYPGKTMQGNNQIAKDKPAPTIRAEHHGNIEAHYNTTDGKPASPDFSNVRRLSVRECARIQTFPDSFVFPCSASQAYRQIGNAVPPVLAWHIGRAVARQLNNLTAADEQKLGT